MRRTLGTGDPTSSMNGIAEEQTDPLPAETGGWNTSTECLQYAHSLYVSRISFVSEEPKKFNKFDADEVRCPIIIKKLIPASCFENPH